MLYRWLSSVVYPYTNMHMYIRIFDGGIKVYYYTPYPSIYALHRYNDNVFVDHMKILWKENPSKLWNFVPNLWSIQNLCRLAQIKFIYQEYNDRSLKSMLQHHVKLCRCETLVSCSSYTHPAMWHCMNMLLSRTGKK